MAMSAIGFGSFGFDDTKQTRQNDARVEIGFRNVSRTFAVRRVVCVDFLNPPQCLIWVLEGDNASADRQPLRKARVLNHDWPTACQIARAAFAKPAAARDNIAVL